MALRTWSASDLAQKSGLSRPSVTNALKGRPVKPATLKRILAALTETEPLEGAERIV
jgi:DNA-binding LacI/PurR family transcriptional regulator